MDNNRILELKNVNTEEFAVAIANATKAFTRYNDYTSVTLAAAYVIQKARQDDLINTESMEEFVRTSHIDDKLAFFIRECLADCWTNIIEVGKEYELDVLQAYILYFDTYNFRGEAVYTPTGLSQLAVRLLGISPNETVVDYCTGRASFIRDGMAMAPEAFYYGKEINTTSVCIAMMRADVLGDNVCVTQEDVFNMDVRLYDRVFSNYPFGLRLREIEFYSPVIQNITEKYPHFSKSVSSDWIFNALLVESMSPNGKAVGIMTNSGTWNKFDMGMRKDLLEQGYIEAVIALPERLFESTSISTCMIVFSHNNESVTFVDARTMCDKGRRNNIITERHIDQIMSCVSVESEFSRKLTLPELADNDYIINPVRYMEATTALENGIPFESIITNITRGAQLSAAQLDELVSDTPTEIQYLMLGNIQEGTIDNDLPYLKLLDPRYEKYCLKSKAIILSKNGYPFKVAIAEVPEGKRILANGNLYVIEIDETKADPYFIKAFLESDKGIAALKSITVGATIPNIGIEQLRRILVPSTPIEQQHEIAQRYLAKIDEIAIYRIKIEKAKNALKHIIDLSEEV